MAGSKAVRGVGNHQRNMKKSKVFSLSDDERTSIDSRQSVIKQYQYLIHVINADIQAYLNFVVCPREGIKEGEAYKLSPDNKTIVLEEDDPSKAK